MFGSFCVCGCGFSVVAVTVSITVVFRKAADILKVYMWVLLCSAPAQKIPFPRLEFVVSTKDFLYQNNAVLMACPLKHRRDSSYLLWIEQVFDELDQAPFVLHRHARTSHQPQGVTREKVCRNYAMYHSLLILTLIFFTQCKDTTNTLSAHDHHNLDKKTVI